MITEVTKKKRAAKPAKVADDPARYAALKWLLSGRDEREVRELLAAQYPKANADKVLAAIMDHLAQVGDADRLVLNGWCYLAARELIAKMDEAGELKAALAAIKEIHQIANK